MTNQHLEVVMAQLLKAPPVGLAGVIICIPLADQTEERLAVLVNGRRHGQIFVYRYFVGRHGDDDAVADDGTCAGIGT